MEITLSGLEVLRRRSPLAVIAAERGISLQRQSAGRLQSRCPFCRAFSTFVVREDVGRFECRSCSAFGDVLGFVARHDGLDLAQAMRALAHRAGFDLGQLMKRRASSPKPVTLSTSPTTRRVSQTPVWALTPPPWMHAEFDQMCAAAISTAGGSTGNSSRPCRSLQLVHGNRR
jgi:CHC2 zinc finger